MHDHARLSLTTLVTTPTRYGTFKVEGSVFCVAQDFGDGPDAPRAWAYMEAQLELYTATPARPVGTGCTGGVAGVQ